jgi:predicted HAD superfamily Cof-like phosphohydrolase
MRTEELQEAYGPKPEVKGPRNSYERVREFMENYGHPVYDEPTAIADPNWETMRLALIQEEFAELLDACGYDLAAQEIRDVELTKWRSTDLVEAADALGDLDYVVNGAALGMGIPLPDVTAEIHRSNMSKMGADGKPIYREDGKVLKGPNYSPPNLIKVLFG